MPLDISWIPFFETVQVHDRYEYRVGGTVLASDEFKIEKVYELITTDNPSNVTVCQQHQIA